MESAAAVKGTINGFDKYFSLYDFEKEKDINELSAIIGLFDLDDVPLEGSITVDLRRTHFYAFVLIFAGATNAFLCVRPDFCRSLRRVAAVKILSRRGGKTIKCIEKRGEMLYNKLYEKRQKFTL
ncbi:MAG: hypothetical protein LBQ40_04560 [Clostridiales bacterium]|jgi:hypothetical protein|nr:hypothetical protein [Clostridiales bacterium]